MFCYEKFHIGLPVFFYMSSLNMSEHWTIERGLVVMGCVLDVVRGVLASIKRGHPERGRGHSYFNVYCNASVKYILVPEGSNSN